MATLTRRAVLYGRVSKLSKAEQARAKLGPAEGRSVDQQLGELRRLAERDQVAVVAEHRDDGISASRYGRGKVREGWRDTMATITSGEVTELWAWEISRATRDRPVWAALMTACIANAVKVTIQGKVHDPTDPDDGFMLDLMAALAVRESAVTSKRIKRDIRAAAVEGKPHGRIPYGYRRIYDELTGELIRQEPDPAFVPVIEEIVARTIAEHAHYAVAMEFNARGVPSPHEAHSTRLGHPLTDLYPWTSAQVTRLVRNPTYAGLRAHNEGGLRPGQRAAIVGPAAWDGIVDRETWERAQLVVERPGRDQVRDRAVKHLLSGIARCGVCGNPCRVTKNRGYLSYACWGTPLKPGSACVSRRQLPVDLLVAETIIEWAQRPDVRERLAMSEDDDDAAGAAREVEEIERQLDDVERAVTDRRMSVALAGRIEARLLPLLEAARARSVPRSVNPAVLRLVGPGARERWEALLVAERRQIVRALVTVTINKSPYKSGTRGFDPELIEIAGLP